MTPKILVLDVELSPLIAHAWALFDQNIGLNQIEKDWHLLSWAAKWVGEKKIHYADQSKAKNIENDKAILISLRELIDQADCVLGHNIKKFDLKKINARMIKHGIRPFNESTVLDTLTMAKSQFAFTSNKLEYIAKYLGVGEKSKHSEFNGHELWTECMRGNQKAWKVLRQYNENDVIITEQVYEKLRPYCKTYNHGVYSIDTCDCGSKRLESNGYRNTQAGRFKRLRCSDCGKCYQVKQNEIPKNDRKLFLKKA